MSSRPRGETGQVRLASSSRRQFGRNGPDRQRRRHVSPIVSTFKGLPEEGEARRTATRVPLRDAGFVSFNDTFDANIPRFPWGGTISPENGPHPDLDSGFTLFCDVIVRR
jgi:hypothetical protein